jgi:hypothetical protein
MKDEARRTSEELSVVIETWYGIRLWHIEQSDTLGKKSGREKLRPTLMTKDSLADFTSRKGFRNERFEAGG